MELIFGLALALVGVMLIIAAKQVSHDTQRPTAVGYSNLTARISPSTSRVARAFCILSALLLWFA